MELAEKLLNIQNELKAPKNQYNKFGGYNYRSCEDILEAVKPLLAKYKATLTINDDIVMVGERIYVKADVALINIEDGRIIHNVAFAREEDIKKGMDGSQITGASSSYARKYALNGLFLIDDTKDSDATNTHGKDAKKLTDEQYDTICDLFDEKAMPAMLKYFNVNNVSDLTEEQAKKAIAQRKKTLEEKKNE